MKVTDMCQAPSEKKTMEMKLPDPMFFGWFGREPNLLFAFSDTLFYIFLLFMRAMISLRL